MASYAVFTMLRGDFEGRLKGSFEPVLFRNAFIVKGVHWNMPGKVRVDSGTVRVRYFPLSFLKGDGFRLVITGEKLPVELSSAILGENIKKITLERVNADIKLQDGEIQEIYNLEVVSPELNLKIGQ